LSDEEYFVAWIRAFLFTQIVEAPIYRRLLGVSWLKSVLASSLTHPFVWFAFPLLRSKLGVPFLVVVGFSELFAWLVEAALFALTPRLRDSASQRRSSAPKAPQPVPWKRALLVSFVANGASVVLGLTSRAIFGVP